MVYDMACWTWHGIWYGLARYGIIYCMAWRTMAWYMITPGEVWHGMWKCLCEFHPRSLISAFVVRCQDRMIPLVYISEISRV